MNICVVGTGYVGLVTGSCLADFGMHVTGVDVDEAKDEALRRGEIPIYEPGLDELVRKMSALAIEGLRHFRAVHGLLRARGRARWQAIVGLALSLILTVPFLQTVLFVVATG